MSDYSPYPLLNRKSGLQAVWNYLQSKGQTSLCKAWWLFNEASGNLIDQTANNNDLTASGTPTYRQADYLGLSRAIAFDGTTDYFSIADGAQTGLDLNGAEILTDGGLEVWTGDNLNNWVETESTSTVTKEIVLMHGDAACAKFTIDAINTPAEIKQDNDLEAYTQYTIEFWYKTEATKTCKAYLKNLSTGEYLHSDGTWGAVDNYVTNLSNVVWTKTSFNFTSTTAASYKLGIQGHNAASSSFYIDDISLTECRDAVILVVVKPGADVATNRYLIRKIAVVVGYYFRINQTNGKLTAYISDGVNTTTSGANTAVNDNAYHLFQINYDRDSATGLNIILDGSSDLTVNGDLTAIGNIDNATAFHLGSTEAPINFFLGSIAEVMMLVGSPLPANVLSDAFALFAHKQCLWYPLNTPWTHKKGLH